MIVAIQIAGLFAGLMIVGCICNVTSAIAQHRKAQAASILKHAGFLDDDEAGE